MKSNTSSSKTKWRDGLLALNKLWKRGLFPENLEKHYFLHWFVVYNGNIIKTAAALKIHRNTIQGHFLKLGYSRRSVKLRHVWQALSLKQKSSFENRFYAFYKKFAVKPRLSLLESRLLIGLWQSHFPFKILTHHYLLWALRDKKSKTWLQSQLDYSYRHQARILSQIGNPKSKAAHWLSPLKPQPLEIYSERYKTRLRNSRRKR